MASYIFCEQCIRKKSEKITGNTEDVHKKICISSFLSYSIYFVNEHYARSLFICLFKQISYFCSTHTYKHFHKFRTGN